MCGPEVDLQTDPNNCGGCGHICPNRPHSTATCGGGQCEWSCVVDFDDCDHDLGSATSNGCEANLAADPQHCGTCATACTAGPANTVAACSNHLCQAVCAPNFANCDVVASNGCEADLRTTSNCGECGQVCASTCTQGACDGQQPLCRLFEAVAPRAVNVSLASDGSGFAVVWNDFDNHGLWVAGLGPTGKVSVAPRQLAALGKATPRFGIAFDGTSYVVAWATDEDVNLHAQRLETVALTGSGAQASLPVSFSSIVFVVGAPGRVLIVAGDDHVSVWMTSAAAPPPFRPLQLPSSDVYRGVLGAAAVQSGWVIASGSGQGLNNQAMATLVLAADGTQVGGPSVHDSGKPLLHPGYPMPMVSLASGGALAFVDFMPIFPASSTRALALDAQGHPIGTSATWNETPLDQPAAGAGVRNGGAWLVKEQMVIGSSPLTAIPVNDSGLSGQPTALATLPRPAQSVGVASNAQGTLFVWSRSRSGTVSALEAVFLTQAGVRSTPCD